MAAANYTKSCCCEICGTTFFVRPYEAGRFCSRACFFVSRRRGRDIECTVCGKLFYATGHLLRHGNGKFCSRDCYHSITRPLSERFWEKVNKDGPVHPVLGTACWLWTGGTNRGYGVISADGRFDNTRTLAHRVSWELVNGPIPDGLCSLHHCDNPPCVRAEPNGAGHLFIGTNTDNMRDMVAKGRDWRGIPAKGVDHPMAKLTECDVLEIRRMRAIGESIKEIAERFEIAQSAARGIVNRKTWSHI